MPGHARKIIAAAIAISVAAVPTAVISAAPTSVSQPTAQQAATVASENPWLTPSAMTTGGTGNAAAIARAQGDDDGDCDLIQFGSARDDDDDRCGMIPIAPLAVALGTFALGTWILVHDGGNGDLGLPLSP